MADDLLLDKPERILFVGVLEGDLFLLLVEEKLGHGDGDGNNADPDQNGSVLETRGGHLRYF